METQTYELRTIKDIFEKVPADKIALCLSEIGQVMVVFKTTIKQAGLTTKDVEWPEVSNWTDDGKGTVGAQLVVKGESEPAMTVMLSPDFAITEHGK